MKIITRIVPVSLCALSALIVCGCDQNTSSTTATAKPANQQTPATPTQAPKSEPATPDVAAAPATAASAVNNSAPQATPTPTPAANLVSGDAAGTPATPPAQKVANTVQYVKADPAQIDLGEIPTNDSKTGKLRLVNSADKPMTVQTVRASCGCTALKFTPNTVIPAKESIEIDVQMTGGVKDGPITGKNVTVVVEGQPEVIVPITATAISFVKADPATLDPDSMPEGKFKLKSVDGQPFKIMSTMPQVVDKGSDESKPEHELTVSWSKYREIGISRQLIVYLDHPKCQQVFVPVNFSREELQKQAQLAQEKARLNKEALGTGTKVNEKGLIEAVDDPADADPDVVLANLVKQGNTVEILQKLQTGLDVNYRDGSGTSLLSMAAKAGQVDLIKALLAIEKIDKNATDNVGRTALMHAATSKNVEAVRVLLDAGADVRTRDNLGTTALSWAAWLGDVASVQELIDNGSEVEVVSSITGWTPLILAAGFGETGAVDALLNAHAELEAADMLEGATPLIHASRTGKPETIKLLIKRGAKLENPDRNGNTALLACAKTAGGDADKIKVLIEAGADIHAKDNRGYNALQLAQKRTDMRAPDVIKILEPLLASETPAAASTEPAPGAGS